MHYFRTLSFSLALAVALGCAMAGSFAAAASAPSGTRIDLNAGVGIPHGVIGVSGEVFVAPQFSLSAGVGATPISKIGWDVGAQY